MRVSSGNCAVFVANRIIIGAGAKSWVVIGPVEGMEIGTTPGMPAVHLDNVKT